MNFVASSKKVIKTQKMTNDVAGSQYDISPKHFTVSFILTDKNIIRR